ncbi:hypothetical protein C5O00_08595 [Pukyongia salina]|uniref:Uncharacterized protein n=1 Tax=Pukyongia salina TaxID=2094025 RepID=A0A2S0HX46_9FLAO|nr:hypothetical protein [Pukyongia salina]AVI51229.1 hypothetical protein C5O00_08595 [Pukyongia salina]
MFYTPDLPLTLTPQEYPQKFEFELQRYINEYYGDRYEFIMNLLNRLEEVYLYTLLGEEGSEVGPIRAKEIQDAENEIGHPHKFANMQQRKIDFLKSELAKIKDENVQPLQLGINGCLKMTKTETVELIRALDSASCLNVNLKTMYEIFGLMIGEKIDGDKISAKVKERHNTLFIDRLKTSFHDIFLKS